MYHTDAPGDDPDDFVTRGLPRNHYNGAHVRWFPVTVLVAGCAFDPSPAGVSGDGPGLADGPVPDDDAITVNACTFTSTGAEVDAPVIGGTGGTSRDPVVCLPGELPIGLGFDVSSGGISNHANQVAMVHVHARCGRLARDSSNGLSTTPTGVIDRNGGQGGNCSEYFPTVVAAEVTCPSGSILVGVDGNRLDNTLYNTVSIACAVLSPDGTLGTVTSISIPNTGQETNQPMTSRCPPGTAVSSFGIRSGCGHDQLAPRCAPVSCN